MHPGEVIAERFEIEHLVGSGGMGDVYRGRDRSTGEAVAVKVLHGRHASEGARFVREAEVLAELSHPGIVRHVAHGTTPSGELYMAMEWLSGEDLSERLRRAPLTVEQTVTLVARVAEALASVHAHGIVHRDLKPSNLFLVERDVARVKLLDFGVAWLASGTQMTQTGTVIGTPAYMAPEQVRTEGCMDVRADVFSLGCVLFECLSGRPAFSGVHFMAVLGKILFAEVPRLCEIVPETPRALDALCARMLAKRPEDRPRNVAEVAAALEGTGLEATILEATLPAVDSVAEAPVSSRRLTQHERRILSVALMGPPPLEPSALPSPLTKTRVVSAPSELRQKIEARGGHLERLADGSLMVTVVGTGMAMDQATQAARCAFALCDGLSGRPVAVATGRAEVGARLPAAALLDRAAQMLVELAPGPGPAPITIDEVTAGLLDGRFEVVESDTGLVLRREQVPVAGVRRLAGKLTTCVGRDFELGALMASFAECLEESRARAVLLTAPAGMGKTRLAQELLSRLQQQGESFGLWIGRGDPMRRGASLGLLAQALGGALGIQDGEPIERCRAKLAARVAAQVDTADEQRVAEFLGEIVGTRFPDEDSVQLRAARMDAQLMGDQMRRAWVDFLGAQCSSEPVLLVLEDLHWGDLPTVQFVDEALRRLKDRPWMVLAPARPEVHERFPGLWAQRSVQEIRLGELSRKASVRLVRQVLGERVGAETVDRLVTHADGNAFYLEELIRAAAEGRREALPETVLSMLEGRLEALDAAARRVLRAASVFGQTFWRGGVAALLSGEGLDERLEQLEQKEWIHRREESRFQGERELHFRHALVRDAAYGMLTEDDRALGHRLAGAWLEQVAEPSAATIGEHFEHGGETARAAVCYRRAAEQALAANDLGAVLSWTERALSLGAAGHDRGELALLRADAHFWRGDDTVESGRWADEALACLPKGSPHWYMAAVWVGITAMRQGQPDRMAALTDALASAWSEEEATGPAVAALAGVLHPLLFMGLHEQAEAVLARIDAVAERFSSDPAVTGHVLHSLDVHEQITGNLGRSWIMNDDAVRCFERAGDLRYACRARVSLGYKECLLGAYPEAMSLLRAVCAEAEQMGLEFVAAYARNSLGLALGALDALDEARTVEEQAVTAFVVQGNRRLEGLSRVYLAWILRRAGDLEAAEAEARRAMELLEVLKPVQVTARGTLADVLLARGRPAEALTEARRAMTLLGSLGKVHEREALVRLAHAEALEATGDHEAARAAIAGARDRLLEAAARIDDAARRWTFLESVPENARTLALARAWLQG